MEINQSKLTEDFIQALLDPLILRFSINFSYLNWKNLLILIIFYIIED